MTLGTAQHDPGDSPPHIKQTDNMTVHVVYYHCMTSHHLIVRQHITIANHRHSEMAGGLLHQAPVSCPFVPLLHCAAVDGDSCCPSILQRLSYLCQSLISSLNHSCHPIVLKCNCIRSETWPASQLVYTCTVSISNVMVTMQEPDGGYMVQDGGPHVTTVYTATVNMSSGMVSMCGVMVQA